MQDNAQNNWKQALENTDAFPGEILPDKNATWEKLYTRLHKKPTRKFVAWYWAAAACMLLATTTIIFLNKETHQPSLPVTSSSKANEQSSTVLNKPLAKEPKKTKNVSFQTLKKNTVSISSPQRNIPVKKEEIVINNNLSADSAPKELLTEAVSEPVLQSDSVKEITTAAPVKKKLKVVHVNDLGQPMEESTADNKFAEIHRFQLRIINGENYNPVSPGPGNNGIILFKLKSASN